MRNVLEHVIEPVVLTTSELLALLSAGVEQDFSALSEQPYILLTDDAGLSLPASEALAARIRHLACPVIGLIKTEPEPEQPGAWQTGCDVLVSNLEQAKPLIKTILRCPIAAMVFVQTLRITENMPVEAALTVESLAYTTLQSGPEYRQWLADNQAESVFEPDDDGPAVLVERQGAEVGLTLNRASNRNAMNVEMRDALMDSLQSTLLDEGVKSLKIQGLGKCFSTGGDLREFGTVPDPATGHVVRSLAVPGRLLSRVTERLGDKAVAHLHGACIGSGMEFPAFAERITADQRTHFQLPEVGMGLIPGAGGCVSIARRIGRQRTAWLGLSGKRIKVEQALGWGLVDELV